MNSNLTPEPRVNKLGHTVIKHVKTPRMNIKIHPSVPPPTSGPDPHRNNLIDAVMSAVKGSLNFGPLMPGQSNKGLTNPKRFHDKIAKFSTDTLERIKTVCESDERPASTIFWIICEGDERQIREVMTVLPFTNGGMQLHPDTIARIVNGLHHLDHFKGTKDLSNLDEQDTLIAAGFFDVTTHLVQYAEAEGIAPPDKDKGEYHLNNPDLIDLIVTRPDKVERMTEVIAARCTGDAALIRAYVENGSALREGAL